MLWVINGSVHMAKVSVNSPSQNTVVTPPLLLIKSFSVARMPEGEPSPRDQDSWKWLLSHSVLGHSAGIVAVLRGWRFQTTVFEKLSTAVSPQCTPQLINDTHILPLLSLRHQPFPALPFLEPTVPISFPPLPPPLFIAFVRLALNPLCSRG